jgi:hypothetical protein
VEESDVTATPVPVEESDATSTTVTMVESDPTSTGDKGVAYNGFFQIPYVPKDLI